jgi:hypothetical protein
MYTLFYKLLKPKMWLFNAHLKVKMPPSKSKKNMSPQSQNCLPPSNWPHLKKSIMRRDAKTWRCMTKEEGLGRFRAWRPNTKYMINLFFWANKMETDECRALRECLKSLKKLQILNLQSNDHLFLFYCSIFFWIWWRW